jgi:mRNA interferase RelE/StbE
LSYQLLIERHAAKSLADITPPHRERIYRAIRGLALDPRPPGAKKLSGRDAWRLRVGDYRIIYEIHDDALVILVVAVGPRKDVYR